jgi:hypothetical protein
MVLVAIGIAIVFAVRTTIDQDERGAKRFCEGSAKFAQAAPAETNFPSMSEYLYRHEGDSFIISGYVDIPGLRRYWVCFAEKKNGLFRLTDLQFRP